MESMTPSLKSKLLAACEHKEWIDYFAPNCGGEIKNTPRRNSSNYENARLMPIIRALLAANEEMEKALEKLAAQAQPREFKDGMLVVKKSDAMAEWARIALLANQEVLGALLEPTKRGT
jgi:hypothetical protein